MPRRRANAIALAVLGTLVCGASRARAYEDQVALGVGAGYAHAIDAGEHAPGIGADFGVSIGLGAAWALRARGGYSGHPGTPDAHLLLGAAELLYVIDVVELVPYAGLGAGVLAGDRPSESGAWPSANLVAGCDYLLSRSVALELDLRAAFVVSELPAPSYFTALVSFVFLFDR